jgi:hypothetical protein
VVPRAQTIESAVTFTPTALARQFFAAKKVLLATKALIKPTDKRKRQTVMGFGARMRFGFDTAQLGNE